jgi:hypothetical protein
MIQKLYLISIANFIIRGSYSLKSNLKQEKMQVLILIKKVIGKIESERNLWRELYVLSDRGLLIVKMKNHIENRPLS